MVVGVVDSKAGQGQVQELSDVGNDAAGGRFYFEGELAGFSVAVVEDLRERQA